MVTLGSRLGTHPYTVLTRDPLIQDPGPVSSWVGIYLKYPVSVY